MCVSVSVTVLRLIISDIDIDWGNILLVLLLQLALVEVAHTTIYIVPSLFRSLLASCRSTQISMYLPSLNQAVSQIHSLHRSGDMGLTYYKVVLRLF